MQTQLRYCRNCYYSLRGLLENRCPECGQTFDPADPATYSLSPKPPPRTRALLLAYGVPLGVTLWFWLAQDSTRWAGMGRRLAAHELAWFAAASACGPLAWNLESIPQSVQLWAVPVLCIAFWLLWLLLACKTMLRKLPWPVHLGLAALWCFAGCARIGLVIT